MWRDWLEWSASAQIMQMAILVGGGLAVYAIVLVAAGLRWRDVYR
jgi:hypothetical protein